MVKINSSPITFIDATDSRKFEVHINSNLQQVQVYNKNNSTYSPDWSNTPLTMRASVYLDSTDITANTNVTFTWYKNEISTAAKIGSGKDLIINANVLATEPVITYICQATYQNLTASSRMDYARIDSGLDGVVGNSAPAVQARYSVDGITSWTLTLNAATHKYVQYSYDGGITWTTAIKMAGEDGKSVAILGTAYTPDDLTVGEVVRLYSNYSNTTAINTNGLSTGDSYLVSGYLCVYNADNNSFICTGKIQGPAGNDGQSSYVFIRYATDANGTSMSTSPSGKTHIGIYTSNTNVAPTTASSYTWSKFVGDNAKSIILSGDSQVFKVSKTSAYTPTTIKVVAQTINTSVTAWTYSVNGGQTFSSTAPTGVVQNGNIVTITGSTLTSNSVVIKSSDGTIEDVFTVYKAFDGTDGSQGAPGQSSSMAFLTNENVTFGANAQGQITGTAITTNVVAYTGTTKSTPTIGTISGLPTGMTATIGTAVNNEVPITLTIASNATLGSTSSNNGSITIPVNGPVYTNLILSWSKVNSGAKGDDASFVKITPSSHYFKSTTGKDGTFTPDYIYLYPRFQTVTYSKWEYSTDGGTTWVAASGANGLTISTYNSVANTLRIAKTSTLYTDTITSISFRCVSSTATVYDTVSIAKIYDVVDLQIGGRNLAEKTNQGIANWSWSMQTGDYTKEEYIDSNQTKCCKLTKGSTTAQTGWSVIQYNNIGLLKYEPNQTYTISFDVLASVTTTMSVKLLHPDGTKDLASVYIPINKQVTENTWSKIIYTATTLSTFPTLSGQCLYITGMNSSNGVSYILKNVKIEKGNKATDWTPAPEDIDANIATVNTTLTNSIADVKTTTNSIASRVSATETSITTINGNVSSLTTKVTSAEQKITPTAIVSTVRSSTDYTNDLSQKVGTTEIISKINQTAESVTISASKIGLLGATNIPDLTADKIKGGTLTLGGSNAATQNGQLVVKNASNADMIKLNKSGVVVKAGHLAVASDFTNQSYNFSTDTWTTTTNTSQLDLSDKYVRMGVYSSSGYANNMKLTNSSLSFRGSSQGYGDWGSFIGHDEYYDFVIQDSVRGYILFRGQGDTELAMIDGAGIVSSGLYSNTISSSSNVHIDSSGRMYRSTSSSKRYKTDIQDVQTEYLKPEKLYDLPIREFKYKEGYLSKEDPRIDTFVPGFIAEEVNEVYPIACEYDGDKPENWNIRFIVPAMLKLIQDQKKEIDTLKELIGNKEVNV